MKLEARKGFWIAGALALIIYFGKEAIMKTRGLRNNNPGNIKELPGDTTQWLGERATDDDPVFEEFETPGHGIRAIGKIIDSYRRRGVITVRQIIETWAPGSENNTEAYVHSVAKQTGWQEDFTPNRLEGNYTALVKAIIKHENGINPYDDDFIADSLAIA